MIMSIFFIKNGYLYDLFKIAVFNLIFIISTGIILGEIYGLTGVAAASTIGELINLFLQKNKIKSYIIRNNGPV
jgi:hypothetical protein